MLLPLNFQRHGSSKLSALNLPSFFEEKKVEGKRPRNVYEEKIKRIIFSYVRVVLEGVEIRIVDSNNPRISNLLTVTMTSL